MGVGGEAEGKAAAATGGKAVLDGGGGGWGKGSKGGWSRAGDNIRWRRGRIMGGL